MARAVAVTVRAVHQLCSFVRCRAKGGDDPRAVPRFP